MWDDLISVIEVVTLTSQDGLTKDFLSAEAQEVCISLINSLKRPTLQNYLCKMGGSPWSRDGGSPSRSLLDSCNLLIEETVSNYTHHGWAGFILHEQWRKIKVAVKAWHLPMQTKLKEKEKLLLSELEICDATADSIGLNEEECIFRSALQAELLSIYHLEECNLI
ncbi:hypothetical protein E6C27_scaffold131G00910 [Cucumis melo var. makuwa]|uniref:Uncharacterized protein n=1 Tax=Cucumis melo var. makuwa TaxID=1194695 RepID=A0A5A7UED8_CUCMM|nr:hypothetical protein E6C27_scaffold131G00910 [Cucumis melo var. makuwa]